MKYDADFYEKLSGYVSDQYCGGWTDEIQEEVANIPRYIAEAIAARDAEWVAEIDAMLAACESEIDAEYDWLSPNEQGLLDGNVVALRKLKARMTGDK